MVQSKGTVKDITEMWDGDGKSKKSTDVQGKFIREVKFCIGSELGNFIDFQKRFMPSSLFSKSLV